MGAITELTGEKKREFPLYSISYPRIKTEKKDLAERWLFNIRTRWKVNKYTFNDAEGVCHEHLILRNLVLRLNHKQDLDLGGLNARNLVQCLQYSLSIQHRAMFNNGEKKGSRSAQNRRQDLLHQVVGRQFLLREYNKMAKKGGEIKVHFTFVMDEPDPFIC